MGAPATSEIFLFEGFRFDRRGGGLFRKDDADADAPVAIGSRALDILGALIARSGEVVSKDEIIAAVWPGTIVEDSNLTVQISALRRVLDRGRRQGSCIQTVPGRGYRFVAVVANPAAEAGSAPSPVTGDAEHAEEGAAAVAPLPIDAGGRWRASRQVLGAAPSTRRLTAILAADVAGYSRLMGADEEGTHERLQAHLRELIEPKIAEHRGRVVKNTGDGFLAEFASVVSAVRCAVEVQRGMADREPEVPEDRRIRFRIGVNLGDVIAEEHDIFGDGVNVAARLEGLAEPGGICVSRVVRDQVRDKLDYPFEDRGEQSVKNIARPVRVYVLRAEGIAGLPTASVSSRTSSSPPVAAPRLSIVVLPFTNLSDDREQQYFADGITEDLTSDLSQIAGMTVISRNTAFTYRNKSVEIKQIGRELNVRYVLEGSVRRSGNLVRVNAQLIDAETNAHLWAERFTGDTSDLFALQDEITRRIAVALNLELWRVEAARPTQHPDAMDYVFRGRAVLFGGPPSRERWAQMIALFEHALALDPRSAQCQGNVASVLASRVLDNMTDTAAADLARAESLATQALAAAPRSSVAHYANGDVLRAKRRYAEAIAEYEMALSFNPNAVSSLHSLAYCKFFLGSIEEAISLEEQAIRLSPRDPFIGVRYRQIGLVHLVQSRTNDAILWLEKARNANRAHSDIRAQLASAYAVAGQTERAATELAEARRLSGDDRFSSLARLRAVENYEGLVPKVHALLEATYIAGLRKAGVRRSEAVPAPPP